MNNLNDYVIDYCINESMANICNNDQINEGKIMDGIKKLWKWITRKNKKNKKQVSVSLNNNDKKIPIKIEQYDYNKLQQARLGQDMKKTKDAINKYANIKNDIKIIVAKDTKTNQIPAILVYVNAEHSPISKQYDKFKGYAHIFALEIQRQYQEKGLGRKLIHSAIKKLQANSTSLSKGFTINFTEANTKKLYNNIGFNETFEDKDNNVKIMYAKYENIDTKH